MEFSPDLRDGVASGRITVSIRLWRKPRVKVGNRYSVGPTIIKVDDIELLPFSAISATDIRASGEPDRDSLRRRAAHAGPIDDTDCQLQGRCRLPTTSLPDGWCPSASKPCPLFVELESKPENLSRGFFCGKTRHVNFLHLRPVRHEQASLDEFPGNFWISEFLPDIPTRRLKTSQELVDLARQDDRKK